MAANLFQLDSVFFSFSTFFAISVPHAFISDPRVLTPESSRWNWWVAGYPRHSPFGRHVRLQAWLDNHNSLNGIFWYAVISICSLNMLKFVCKLNTLGNLSLCSVKRNVKSYIYILHVLKLINQWFLLFIFHLANVCHLPLPMYRNWCWNGSNVSPD